MGDGGESLVQQFRQASTSDVRDDIAAGIARAGNSMGGRPGGTPEEVARKTVEARARFKLVYEGTSDAAVRRSLARAALYGMGCVGAPLQTDDQKADAGRFFREVAALEPDPVQRERLERIAAAFETRGDGAYQDFDKILAGKE